MAKDLDGIKKLNPDDVKKYRKIVLNYIGEKDAAEVSEKKSLSPNSTSPRKVDGLISSIINRSASKKKETPKLAPVLSEKKDESVKSPEREEERMKEAIRRQAEERQKIKDEERQYQMDRKQAERAKREQEEKLKQEKIRLEKERVARERAKEQEIKRAAEIKAWEEKIKLEEQEEKKQRRIREQLQRKKAKRAEEVNRINREREIKNQAIREKKRIKRQKAWKRVKKNLKFKLNIVFSKIRQNLFYVVSFALLFFAIAYLIFCLAVLRFNNRLTGWAANYVSVPAIITGQGIISYNSYKKIEDKSYSSLAEKKNYLVKWAILHDLKEKYGNPADLTDDALAIKFVLDKDFNQIGLSRINKINELLKGGSEIESLSQYADEYSDGAYYDNTSAVEKFGQAILELAVGQTSQVPPRANGYYLVKRIDDKNGQLGLKYIFVKSLILNQYLANEISKARVFILAN